MQKSQQQSAGSWGATQLMPEHSVHNNQSVREKGNRQQTHLSFNILTP